MSESIIERADRFIAKTYSRFPIVLEKGRGCRVWDINGKEYNDFVAGIAVCNLGHCHPAITKAIQEQVEKLLHVSNLYYTIPQVELAGLLIENCFADRVFLPTPELKQMKRQSSLPENIFRIRVKKVASG
jgi:acetylornithine/N-succinyldiaminopimelate aminotransferase